MSDPTVNITKYTRIGLLVGIFLSLLANGILIISPVQQIGENLAKGLVWLLPALGIMVHLIHFFKIVKFSTKTRGFFTGFTLSTGAINFAIAVYGLLVK